MDSNFTSWTTDTSNVLEYKLTTSEPKIQMGIGSFYYYSSPKISYIPAHIIYQPEHKITIVIWEDGTKTMVKCSEDEQYIPEYGVAMATIKKIYGSRAEFLRKVDSGSWQKILEKKPKDQT